MNLKLKPVAQYILIAFHFAEESSGLEIPSYVRNDTTDEVRNRFEVLDVGAAVTTCKPGNFVILRPDSLQNLIPTSKTPPQGLIHEHAVLAIELDNEIALAN